MRAVCAATCQQHKWYSSGQVSCNQRGSFIYLFARVFIYLYKEIKNINSTDGRTRAKGQVQYQEHCAPLGSPAAWCFAARCCGNAPTQRRKDKIRGEKKY
jgi:hypothetical protein